MSPHVPLPSNPLGLPSFLPHGENMSERRGGMSAELQLRLSLSRQSVTSARGVGEPTPKSKAMYGSHAGFERDLSFKNIQCCWDFLLERDKTLGVFRRHWVSRWYYQQKLKYISNLVWGNVGGTLQEGQQNLAGDSNSPVKAVLIVPGFLGLSQKHQRSC